MTGEIEPVQATTADGVVLRGELVRGSVPTWLVLVHDAGGDLDDWRPLRAALAGSGWSVLALDLRGHGGSDGAFDAETASLDVDLGVTLARRAGAGHVAIVAAGVAALLALRATGRAVAEPSFALADSLVLVAPGPLGDADPAELRGDGLATLVFAGARGRQREDAELLNRLSIGWTVLVTFATDAAPAALVAGPFGAHVADKLAAFVREQAALGGPGVERAGRRA